MAGDGKTWVLNRGTDFRPGPPPDYVTALREMDDVRRLANGRSLEMARKIDFWNAGTVRRWTEVHLALIVDARLNPPRASRGLALAAVAMNDALVAAWNAKYHYLRARPSQYPNPPSLYGPAPQSPSYVSERAAMSTAVVAVLKYLFPARSAELDILWNEALSVDLWAGAHFPSDVSAGKAMGDAVAARVLDRAYFDGADSSFIGERRTGPGYWEPTAPAFVQEPVESACGQWKPWVLSRASVIRPPAPPAYQSAEFNAQLQEVWLVNQNLTPERLRIAQFWADGPGTLTPPGHWHQIALDLAVSERWNEPRTARLLALLAIAQADAFIACWEAKFFYWCVRPITEVRRVYDPTWLSPITTPPFPSYPSGHSTTSGAAANLLAYYFPESSVTLFHLGLEAMNSRLYGGIHFSFDNYTGFQMGAAIAARALNVAEGQ